MLDSVLNTHGAPWPYQLWGLHPDSERPPSHHQRQRFEEPVRSWYFSWWGKKSTADSSLDGVREDEDLSKLSDGWYTATPYICRNCAHLKTRYKLTTANERGGPGLFLLPTKIILISSPAWCWSLHCSTLYIHTNSSILKKSGMGRCKLDESLARKKGLPRVWEQRH